MADVRSPRTVVVVGLGRFGSAVALELEASGHEVLAIDDSEEVVQRIAPDVTHAVVADATDATVLRSLGVGDLTHAVIGIGDNIEDSILATAAIVDLGVEVVWAKAVSDAHARILERVGATEVVFPERDVGRRAAHRLAGRLLEYLEFDEGFVLAEIAAPVALAGRTLAELELRRRRGITVVAVKPLGGAFGPGQPETVVEAGALMVVAGAPDDVEGFARG